MKIMYRFAFCCLWLFCCNALFAQVPNPLKKRIDALLQNYPATVGVAIGGPDDRDTLTLNGNIHYPMQSVYKLHLAVALLDQVDKGKFKIDQKIPIEKTDLLPNTWSPLRDAYPDGNISLPLKDLLGYLVSQSDNNVCDLLFKFLGGTKELNRYIHALGIKDINIVATEAEMAKSWEVQYNNWSSPFAALQLLKKFQEKNILSPKSHDLLFELMQTSRFNTRLKEGLPEGTVIAHKTGTSGTNAQQVMAATNDIGIVELPEGKHFTIAVFVTDSKQNDSLNSKLIARIAKTAWEYYAEKSLLLARQKFDYTADIDSFLNNTVKAKKPFNGAILITQNSRKLYTKMFGFSDLDKKLAFLPNDQFLTGAFNQQVIAALILREAEKGNIVLTIPIRKYLPDLTAEWAETVTTHQLLTHTDGIVALDKPLAFTPGNGFLYNHIGYTVLASMLEAVTKMTLVNLSADIFEKNNLRSSFHPDLQKKKSLVKGYTEEADGKLTIDNKTTDISFATAGFISTPNDLVTWNNALHSGKLFSDSNSYKKMMTGYATARDPLLGTVDYGYGIQIAKADDIIQIGQTGYYPGFTTINFYYPATKTNVVILSNVTRDITNVEDLFAYPMQIIELIKKSSLVMKTYPQ